MLFKSLAAGIAFSLMLTAPQAAFAQDRHDYRAQREHRNDKRKNTLLGAGLGLLGGAILSGGDPWATIGGAAAGGAIGNVATKDKRDRWGSRRDDRRWGDRRRDDRRWDDRRWDDDRRR